MHARVLEHTHTHKHLNLSVSQRPDIQTALFLIRTFIKPSSRKQEKENQISRWQDNALLGRFDNSYWTVKILRQVVAGRAGCWHMCVSRLVVQPYRHEVIVTANEWQLKRPTLRPAGSYVMAEVETEAEETHGKKNCPLKVQYVLFSLIVCITVNQRQNGSACTLLAVPPCVRATCVCLDESEI